MSYLFVCCDLVTHVRPLQSLTTPTKLNLTYNIAGRSQAKAGIATQNQLARPACTLSSTLRDYFGRTLSVTVSLMQGDCWPFSFVFPAVGRPPGRFLGRLLLIRSSPVFLEKLIHILCCRVNSRVVESNLGNPIARDRLVENRPRVIRERFALDGAKA